MVVDLLGQTQLEIINGRHLLFALLDHPFLEQLLRFDDRICHGVGLAQDIPRWFKVVHYEFVDLYHRLLEILLLARSRPDLRVVIKLLTRGENYDPVLVELKEVFENLEALSVHLSFLHVNVHLVVLYSVLVGAG